MKINQVCFCSPHRFFFFLIDIPTNWVKRQWKLCLSVPSLVYCSTVLSGVHNTTRELYYYYRINVNVYVTDDGFRTEAARNLINPNFRNFLF